MIRSRNIFTAIFSILLGLVTIFIAAPKKVIKKNQIKAQSSKKEDNLLI